MTQQKHISLFSGVGMTDLAMERLGWKTILTSEVDPLCQDVLKVRFPAAIHCGDVATVSVMDDALRHASAPPGELLVSGGFPCQDVSSAGTAAGLNGQRSGLWAEMARVIREFRPDHVFIENAAILRARGLDAVLSDLDWRGYDAAWDCVPAAAVGAPHIRDRVFVYARKSRHTMPVGAFDAIAVTGTREPGLYLNGAPVTKLPRAGTMRTGFVMEREAQFPAKGYRSMKLWPTPTRADGSGGPGTTPKRTGGKNLRTAVAEQEGNGRLNPFWVEWLMGLPGGWTDPLLGYGSLVPHMGWQREPLCRTVAHRVPLRAKRIRALGNGLVPQAAEAAYISLRKELSNG